MRALLACAAIAAAVSFTLPASAAEYRGSVQIVRDGGWHRGVPHDHWGGYPMWGGWDGYGFYDEWAPPPPLPAPVFVQPVVGETVGFVRSYDRTDGILTLSNGQRFVLNSQLNHAPYARGEKVDITWRPYAGERIATRITLNS